MHQIHIIRYFLIFKAVLIHDPRMPSLRSSSTSNTQFYIPHYKLITLKVIKHERGEAVLDQGVYMYTGAYKYWIRHFHSMSMGSCICFLLRDM